MQLLSTATSIVDGTVSISIRCRWTIRCDGVLVLFDDPGRLDPESRIGAADLLVPPGRTRTVQVGLTPGGRRAMQPDPRRRIAVVIVLKWAQGAPDTSQTLRITR